MDNDLDKILDDMWEIKPKITIDFCKVKAMCKLIQELRNKN